MWPKVPIGNPTGEGEHMYVKVESMEQLRKEWEHPMETHGLRLAVGATTKLANEACRGLGDGACEVVGEAFVTMSFRFLG